MKPPLQLFGKKRAKGAAPSHPPPKEEANLKDRSGSDAVAPKPTTLESTSGWSAASLPSKQTIDLSNFLTKLIPVVDSLWKAELRWSKADPTEQVGSLKHLGRNLQAGIDALHVAGFEIKDHTNERYSEGTRVEILAFQPVEGIDQPIVIETLKPTIYFMGSLLRRGQIIVGKPLDPNAPKNP